MTSQLRRTFVIGKTVCAVLAILLPTVIFSGCASELPCSKKPTFFPPAPDEPRIQWLTGITSVKDIGEEKTQSGFSLVMSGREKPDVYRKIGKAYGITAYKGKLYVAETGYARVVIVDPNKGTFEYLRGLSTPKGVLQVPTNLALDKEGYLYVADTGRGEIVVYDPRGDYVTAFGKNIDKGSRIVSVAVYGDKLYALDLGTSLIRVLDRKTGEQTSTFGYSEKANQSLRAPGNFTIDSTGGVYVTNVGNNKGMKYDIDGNFLGSFGGIGDKPGNFVRPRGVAVDENGYIFVVDAGFNIVEIFDDQFRLLTFIGWPGLETGSLNLPAGIAVTKDNLSYFQKFAAPGFQVESLIFVVNQFGGEFCIPRISVYGLGRMQGKPDDAKGAEQDKGEKK